MERTEQVGKVSDPSEIFFGSTWINSSACPYRSTTPWKLHIWIVMHITHIYFLNTKQRFQNISPTEEAAWSSLQGSTDLEESHSAVTATFSSNHQQTLWRMAVAGCWFSPLPHITQSHKVQRHIWWSKIPSTLCIWRGKTDFSDKKLINHRNTILGYKSIVSILKKLHVVLRAKQHRKEVIS